MEVQSSRPLPIAGIVQSTAPWVTLVQYSSTYMTEEEIDQWAEEMLVVIANASPPVHPVALVGSLWVSKTNKNKARVVEANTTQVTFILNERIGLTYSAGRFFSTYREI